MKVLIFAPAGFDRDDPLVRTRWMAERTLETLAASGIATLPVLDGATTRTGLETAVHDDVHGIAFFTHGRLARLGPGRAGKAASMHDDAIMGADGPALDRDNLVLMRGRWGHAIACHVGTELAAQACAHGAECFVGYETSLSVEWHPDDVPEDVKPLLVELVTLTTRNLASGVRGERALIRAVRPAMDSIIDWCEKNPERAANLLLEVTAQQLIDRLVYCDARTTREP